MAMVARMVSNPRTKVQSSEEGRRAGLGFATAKPGSTESDAMNSGDISSGATIFGGTTLGGTRAADLR